MGVPSQVTSLDRLGEVLADLIYQAALVADSANLRNLCDDIRTGFESDALVPIIIERVNLNVLALRDRESRVVMAGAQRRMLHLVEHQGIPY